jgi:methylated-DNA-[protein]-cysteine S-methyltransferase
MIDSNNTAHGMNGHIDLSKLSMFRRRVYEALLQVPAGKVISYHDLGQSIGCASPRAIGQALKNNPYAPIVPCHRVIASHGKIGGFHGHTDGHYIQRKIDLLRLEGVQFVSLNNNNNNNNDYVSSTDRSITNGNMRGVESFHGLRVDASCFFRSTDFVRSK